MHFKGGLISGTGIAKSLLAIWAGVYAASVLQFLFIEPSGEGFTRGLNQIMAFLSWQMLAAILGCTAWFVGRKHNPARGLRILLRLPLTLAGLLFGGLILLIAYARLAPPPERPVQPPEQPAKTAKP